MIPRTLAGELTQLLREYPVITLVGPRQAGKTTLAKTLEAYDYCNLELPENRELALTDPKTFLSRFPDKVILDEIQRVPELLSYIQVTVDEDKRLGRFILIGSNQLALKQSITQSLAGRTATLGDHMSMLMRSTQIGAIILSLAVMGSIIYGQESADSTNTPIVTILSTMLADSISGEAYSSYGEWGFSALVDVGGIKYLYDTGYHPDLVLKNAEKLGIDLAEVEQVILSHAHLDHVGGLITLRKALMERNPAALSTVHVADGFFAQPEDISRSGRDEIAAIMDSYRATGGNVIVHEEAVELAAGVWLSGPVPRIHNERNWGGNARILTADGVVEDNLPEDMAMIIETPKGLVVISGCGHAGIINIVDHAIAETGEERVVAAIGGFHLFQATDEALQWTASHFRRIGLIYFLGAHCTGIEATFRLRELAGLNRTNAVVGAVGQRYGPEGIYAGRIAR